jgi:hypothetical protein
VVGICEYGKERSGATEDGFRISPSASDGLRRVDGL